MRRPPNYDSRHAIGAGIGRMKGWIVLERARRSPAPWRVARSGPIITCRSCLCRADFSRRRAKTRSQSAGRASVDLTQWWRSLHDKELDSLIARAVQSNLDLAIALDRLQEARAELTVVADQALPMGGATGGGGVGTGSDETKGRASQALRSAETATGLKSINEAGGFDAGWELDIFGRIRREDRSADRMTPRRLQDARDWVFVTVAADVARAYLDMRTQQRQLVVLGQDIAAAQGSLDLAQTRFDRGLTNEMDVTPGASGNWRPCRPTSRRSARRSTRAAMPSRSCSGNFPRRSPTNWPGPVRSPRCRRKFRSALPADLLRRRPDIQEAERRLAAATARIGVADRRSLSDGGPDRSGRRAGRRPFVVRHVQSP